MIRFFKNNPLLWFLFPLMAGIAVSYHLSFCLSYTLPILFVSLAVVIAGVSGRLPRSLFGVSMMMTMFALGAVVERLDNNSSMPRWSGEKGCFEAVIKEVPHVGGTTTKVEAYVSRMGLDSVRGARREGKLYIYFANSVDVERLQIGERIFFEAVVDNPRNAGNPAEFDMEHHTYVNGVTGMVYLPVGGWRSLGFSKLTLSMRASELRERLVRYYGLLGFEGDALSVLSALTVGEKRDLSQGVRDIYSDAGASHLLALSGLHLGIIYMIVSAFFPVRAGRRRTMLLRESVVLLLLWAFVFIAGFSPSVVRAAILFSLMALARCLQRDNTSVNTLAFAALLMLLFSPRLLFDVSFQLSFSAVFAILMLDAPLRRITRVGEYGGIYGSLMGMFTMSFAAQIGVLPFVWYYFGTFPLYFFVTNLFAVPAAFCLLLLAILMLLLTPIPFLQQYVVLALNMLLCAMNDALRFVASLPGASLELPYIDMAGAFAVALFIVLLLYSIFANSKKIFFATSVLLLLMVGVRFSRMFRDDGSYVMFYNSRGCPAAQFVVSHRESYLLSSYPEWEIDLSYIAEPYWRREGMSRPHLLSGNGVDGVVTLSDGLVRFQGRTIMMIADDCWLQRDVLQPVDCIYLCRGFLGDIKSLLSKYPSRYIVMDATLYKGSRRRIARECAESGVRCIDLSTVGAVKFLCNKTGVRFIPMRGK